jgi:ribose transport system ATP-binding protein
VTQGTGGGATGAPAHLLLSATGLRRSFGAVRALDGVDFELRPGEVMALLGENGAGKSTLVKILAGLDASSAGTIVVAGEPCELSTPAKSRAAGIAVVQQELSLVPSLSAVENVFLGSAFGGAWSRRRLARCAAPHLQAVGLPERDWLRPVEELSVAERQLIEISRLIARDARILIFDEPTAALSDVEIERVMEVVRRLTAAGHGVVYVTHRLREVFELADRATVMRAGRSQAPLDVRRTTMDELVERMLGRSLTDMYPPRAAARGPERLKVRGLLAPGLTRPVDLTAHRGEIVGLAGQLGSGAPAVLRAIAGVTREHDGTIELDGEPVRTPTIRRALALGIAYCSSDRKRDGIFAHRSVRDNLTAPAVERVSPHGWYSRRRAQRLACRLAETFQINADRLAAPVGTLSGGNQQKVALGKWLGLTPKVLLVEEPTRGVDVGARAEIYAQIRSLADEGLTVLFASSDLPETVGLADTILTLYRGEVVRVADAAELTESQLMMDVTHGPEAVVG